MGMFDWVSYEDDCPCCGNKLSGFQTKDLTRSCSEVRLEKVNNWYTSCSECNTWVEYFRLTTYMKYAIRYPDKYKFKIKKRTDINEK